MSITWNRMSVLFSFLFFLGICVPVFGDRQVDISADAFEMDGTTRQVFASGNVVVTQSDVKIFGDQAEFDQNKQVVQIFKNVRVIRDKMSLNCERVKAYGKEERIEAMGSVRFSYNGISGRADMAKYNMVAQNVELSGSPKAWQGNDEVSGENIIVDLKKTKIRTTGKAKIVFSVDKISEKK